LHEAAFLDRKECGLLYDSLAYPAASGGACARFRGSIAAGCADGIYLKPTARVLKNKHQAVSQGGLRFGKRSICIEM
jgi:hypothetical protein